MFIRMVYVRLLTVLPIALGAWSMALVLWQPPEYYYYLFMVASSKKGDHDKDGEPTVETIV